MSVLLLAVALAGCDPEFVTRASPTPAATPQPTPTTPTDEPIATATPQAPAPRRAIERVTLATRINEREEPVEETSVVSEFPDLIYLCVLMREITDSTRLRAYWFNGQQIIGQSDVSPPPSNGEPRWVALRYRPIARLDPASEYSVELRLGDELIDRYLFRVGVGKPADIVADIAFTEGFDSEGDAINPRSWFAPDERPLVLRMRVSNQVDPTGMSFTSLWYRGQAQVARIDGAISPPAPGSDPDPRRFEFVYEPNAPLPLGNYEVVVLLNGVPISEVAFVVSTDPEPTPTPTPEGTPTPPSDRTPTPRP